MSEKLKQTINLLVDYIDKSCRHVETDIILLEMKVNDINEQRKKLINTKNYEVTKELDLLVEYSQAYHELGIKIGISHATHSILKIIAENS
jgi:hypothetical protein